MTTPSPALLSRLRLGINAENIAEGRKQAYPLATWDTLAARGFTHVRIPVGMIDVMPSATSEVNLLRLDDTLAALLARGFVVSLCPFGGGTLPNADFIVQTLSLLSARYAPMATPDQLMFELRNEPRMFTSDAWNAAIPGMIAAIRANAPMHTIVVPPVKCDRLDDLATLVIPPGERNIVCTFHFYEPATLTQQNPHMAGHPVNPDLIFPAPPGTKGKTGLYTAQKVADRIGMAAAWSAKTGIPLMMGEFGCPWDALTTTCPQPGQARVVWVKMVMAAVAQHPNIVGASYWGLGGKEYGLQPWNRGGWWDEPALDALSGMLSA